MTHHTTKPRRSKPAKPYPEFPLTANGNGQWSKVIRGKTYYFGLWEDWKAALALYKEQVDDLQAGRVPRPKGDVFTVRDLCNAYLEKQEWKCDRGKIKKRTFDDEKKYCQQIVKAIGHCVAEEVGAPEFDKLHRSFPKDWGLVTESHYIKATKRVFKWGYDNERIDRLPRFGSLKPPSRKDIRKEGRQRRAFAVEEFRSILDKLQPKRYRQLRAMVLLGINGGFIPKECAELVDHDIAGEYIDTLRQKTGVRRLVPLWPETRQAIDAWISSRKRRHPDGFLFVTKYGNPWFNDDNRNSPITQEFAKVLRDLGISGSFYCLRHTLQTVCDDEGVPRHVTKAIMGHVNDDISDNYSHSRMLGPITDAVNKVHAWLFGEGGEA